MSARFRLTTACGLFVAAASGLPASSQPDQNSADVSPAMIQRIHPGLFVEQFVATTLQPLRLADVDRDGLSRADVDLAHKRAVAQERAMQMGLFASLDLDGDGRVTSDERDLVTRRPARRAVGDAGQKVDGLARWDRDGDGAVTLDEAYRAVNAPGAKTGRDETLDGLFAFDADGDGKVTPAELEAAARRMFASVDRDGDGLVGSDEHQAVQRQRLRAAVEMAERPPSCDLPAPGKDDQIVAFGVYEGNAMPTATVAGQDQETSTAGLVIEPGDAPLYVVLSSYDAMIWRVTGATSRVARLVLMSSQRVPDLSASAAGATGLPRDKVTIADASACFQYYSQANAPEGLRARAALRKALGRAPDAMGGAYGVVSASVPSMSSADAKASRDPKDTPAGFDPRTWRDASRFTPGGVVEVDPSAVVAAAPASAYEVLPGQMGLARLVGSGDIQRENRWFRVVKPIPRFPAGLAGAHSVSFVIAQGVPAPKGDPGHSCVAYEDPAGPEPAGPMCGRK